MRYLFLAYEDRERWAAMSSGERTAFADACRANDEMLRAQGHLLAAEGLQGGSAAVTVRVCNGEVSVSTGLFVEDGEQLGAIFLVEARDLNQAIYLASRMPQARGAAIEVRPVMEARPVLPFLEV